MNQSEDFGRILKLWPNLVDHYTWSKVIEARDIRNIIAHNAGHLDEELHSKQLTIVAKNLNLNSHQFARVHLEVTQMYVFEVIEAMTSVVNELWRNTTEDA